MDVGIFLAALGISLLELSEAGAVTAIYQATYKGLRPIAYSIIGVALVLIPTFTVGKYIVLLPLRYVLAVSAAILFYFGYRLLRSSRRYFKGIRRHGEEEKEGVGVVLAVSATEALEAALVIIALIPKSYSSALLGTLIAAGAVVLLTIALKDQIARIRLPHLKFVLSSLLFSLGTMWGVEIFTDVDELFLLAFFAAWLGINYAIVKM
ncbi:membrane protein [Thermocladium modestius]|uniref:Membrane protein n=1 Tax=Thermocladium modestius TaxID=62609 RepID=A0A830H081_9CREN|nr:hypothetical protein [Thermocladium modestius]GGP21989.1 membrane protein [Thermocladium modestius]